jgi:tetratricopeptide (TPR) repeat protein
LPKDWRIFAAYAEADCVYKSGDIKKAAVLFKKLFEDEQFSQVAQLSQFRAAYIYLYDLEDILQAKDAFSKLGRNKDEILSDIRSYVEKKIDADMARQCVEQGFILIEEGYTSSLEQRYIGSLEKFDLALSILPNYATAHIGKAVAFCFLNKEVQAVEEGEQAKANAPRDAEVLANLGFIYYNLDMLDQAIKEYEAAVKIQPHIAVLRYNLGTLYLLKAKYPEARENLYRAIAYDREYAKAYNNLGYTLWILGEYTKAKEDFIIATALKPDFIEGRYNLGAVYFALGKYEAAREEFIKVEKLKPQFRKVQYYLSEIKKKLGY